MTDNEMKLRFRAFLMINHVGFEPGGFYAERHEMNLTDQFIYKMIIQTSNIPQPQRVTKEVLNELKLERLLEDC